MAPNRKQIAVTLDPFVNNTSLVQAKYLPLTAETSPATPPQPTIIRSKNVSDDYWSWEEPTDLFSADHLEANLWKDSQREKSATVVTATSSINDSYWAERVEARIVSSEGNAAVSESTGYWEWPEAINTVQIALILKEEFARQQVSGERMEERLQEETRTRKTVIPQDKAENDSYWGWDSPTEVRAEQTNESYWSWDAAVESPQAKQEQMIEAILAYEKVRSLFSAGHTQDNVVESAPVETDSQVKEATNSYWNWPAEEDDYWNMRPLPATAIAAPKGYWDW